MRSRTCIPAVLLVVATLCGCRSHHDAHVARLAPWHSSGANPRQQIVATNTRFGFNVLHDLIGQQPDQNVIISPVSLGLALAMTYNGAGTTTRDAIGKTLQVSDLPIDQVNTEYQALSSDIRRADRRVEVDIANSLWLDQRWPFRPEFRALCGELYGAEVSNVDMSAPETAPTINAWTSKHTGGHIPEVVRPDELTRTAPQALVQSAAYFSGKWTNQFDFHLTQPRPFKLANGDERQVRMMEQRGEYLYQETPEFQAISLPYESGRLSFCVFLPKSPSDLQALAKSRTADNWQQCMSQFAPRPGDLNLPKFRVQAELPLDKALKHLGMTDAFAEGRADFRAMSEVDGVWLDNVRQRMYLSVHEEGTDAAAVTTTMVFGGIIMPRPDRFTMIVDHPFLCAICDNETGAILFMGVVTDPGEAPAMAGPR